MSLHAERIEKFREAVAERAELAFVGVSADLTYLTGLRRPQPSFGAVLHPGGWAEGLWLSAQGPATLVLSRMSAEFSGLAGETEIETRVLGDAEDPAGLVRDLLSQAGALEAPRVLINDGADAESAAQLHELVPGAQFSSATELLREQRRIKGEAELSAMREAGAITERAFEAVLDNLRHGMTEAEVVGEIELQLRRAGSPWTSFPTTLYCSGPRHPLVFGRPEATGPRKLEPPVAVLFDFGAVYEGYCYDFGRTVFFGEPPQEMQRIHKLVMRSQAAGIEALAAGTTAAQTDAAARAVIEEAGYGEAFRHRLGHGIGLDVHEPPFLTEGDDTPLEPGMLFTVEPSITQYGGFSARVEDVVEVGEDSGRPLTVGRQELIVID